MIEVSIIISTYNHPEWLKKVIYGYDNQSFKNFEMIIADDGSGEETKLLIENLSLKVSFPIQHVWHEDNGFRKTIILNEALTCCQSDYVIMSDGDCIPKPDFVETHYRLREPKRFLSGGYHKLPMSLSMKISEEDIYSRKCFDLDWLHANGMPKSFKDNKIQAPDYKKKLLNILTPTTPSWNGHNSSAWLTDILAVNGFDERMEYGGEDRELGERLSNNGIKGKQIRYSTTCLHLDHSRGYVRKDALELNATIRQNTKKNSMRWTAFGIKKKE